MMSVCVVFRGRLCFDQSSFLLLGSLEVSDARAQDSLFNRSLIVVMLSSSMAFVLSSDSTKTCNGTIHKPR